ncbi:hypothetical protein T281_15555 [Rhodomicrobium udaipurense JA643]|nr:hypothetical protein T281_15555 [Rhodomicrobium udaipurense JA643]
MGFSQKVHDKRAFGPLCHDVEGTIGRDGARGFFGLDGFENGRLPAREPQEGKCRFDVMRNHVHGAHL